MVQPDEPRVAGVDAKSGLVRRRQRFEQLRLVRAATRRKAGIVAFDDDEPAGQREHESTDSVALERGGHLRREFRDARFDRALVFAADAVHVQYRGRLREQPGECADQTVVARVSGCRDTVVAQLQQIDAGDQTDVEAAEIQRIIPVADDGFAGSSERELRRLFGVDDEQRRRFRGGAIVLRQEFQQPRTRMPPCASPTRRLSVLSRCA